MKPYQPDENSTFYNKDGFGKGGGEVKYSLRYPSPGDFKDQLRKYMRCEAKPEEIYEWFTKRIFLEIREEKNETEQD